MSALIAVKLKAACPALVECHVMTFIPLFLPVKLHLPFLLFLGLLLYVKGLCAFLVDCTEPNSCDFPLVLGIFSSIKSLIPAESWESWKSSRNWAGISQSVGSICSIFFLLPYGNMLTQSKHRSNKQRTINKHKSLQNGAVVFPLHDMDVQMYIFSKKSHW